MGSVVVVGAGLGGLSTALRLSAAGHRVTILEREAIPGGRAGRFTDQGFTFDTGPTVLTMPALVEELFALHGEHMADHLEIERLDPAYRAVFDDGAVVNIRGSVEQMVTEITGFAGQAEADRFVDFADHLKRLYEAEYDTFIDANFDSLLDLAKPAKMAELIRLGGFRRVHSLVASKLTDWRLQRLFTFQSMYAGMSPYEALGVYAVIAYMDSIAGVYFPKGGIHATSQALADLATRHGVEIRYEAEVARVTGRGRRATGVALVDGEHIPADVVVLNPDLPIAYERLLPPKATPRRVKHLTYSPSCIVVHLGLDRKLLDAAHHNIHFAADYQGSFDDILAGRLQRDPSWFLTVPTLGEPAMAPDGGEVGFVLIPSPNLHGDPINWTTQAPRELEATIQRLEDAKYGPVSDSVVTSRVVTPQDWADQGMAAGTPFAASHHFRQTGPFRPANVAPKVDGVVFVGSSTTPGVGVPMVIVSGRLAAERVQQQLAAR
ncbi:phytoene desaturase family protein [Euzebya tangerina]|uniref:phytoene desaturase family protein n=1 Tax=Euzebya tangerina TaxID=591198 RepID=UPI000E31AD84|nr:phytoene desaturase family protein [Euzebya tangerina]